MEHGSGYAPVNGLRMYYEVHGTGDPLVLVHGSFSAIGSSFGQVLPHLAKSRQVIGLDMQAHGRTADIDRPLSARQLADDIVALLDYLELPRADLFGYSLGAAVGLQMLVHRPEKVRKAVLASVAYDNSGVHPELMTGMDDLKPEMLVGSPWHQEYMEIAPNPDAFAMLVEKIKAMNVSPPELTAEQVRAMAAPTLIMIGDSDIIRPEHAVEFFRNRGGGVLGDLVGLPASQLAILPGTGHALFMQRAEWISSMVNEFLDAPMPESS
jgi:pimeloyl-ACP methyl ester carboxylesterase